MTDSGNFKFLKVYRCFRREMERFYTVMGYAEVDAEFYEHLKTFRWTLNSGGYAHCHTITPNGKGYPLQNLIWKLAGRELPKFPLTIDHIDRDRLNCRIQNLRIASPRLQALNQNLRRGNTSGYKGIYWSKGAKKWCAEVTVEYQYIYLGLFDLLEDAVSARKEAERKFATNP